VNRTVISERFKNAPKSSIRKFVYYVDKTGIAIVHSVNRLRDDLDVLQEGSYVFNDKRKKIG
jgi:hypothetical protein